MFTKVWNTRHLSLYKYNRQKLEMKVAQNSEMYERHIYKRMLPYLVLEIH